METAMLNDSFREPESYALDPDEAMKLLATWLEDSDCGVRPYYGYSGRGMCGATCFGLVGSFTDIQVVLMDFVVDNPEVRDAVRQLVQTQGRDEMGREMIMYFPDVDIPSE